MSEIKRKAVALIGEVSADEVAVRIIEALGQCKRPAGMTATEALNTMPDQTHDARIAAHSVLSYIAECLKDARPPQ